MFNALTLSYARVPAAMARDGMLPKQFARHMDNGVPWVAVIVCGLGWALALGLNLTRLLELDLMLYGFSLILEFAALIALRIREPNLPRPFSIPGGLPVAIGAGVGPTALILFAIWGARGDHLTPGLPAILLGAIIALAGPVIYFADYWRESTRAQFSQGPSPRRGSGIASLYKIMPSAVARVLSAAARLQPMRRSLTPCKAKAPCGPRGAVMAKKSARSTSVR